MAIDARVPGEVRRLVAKRPQHRADRSPVATFVVAKLPALVWVVFRLDGDLILHEGATFEPSWSHALELASEQSPARVIAINDDGDLVAEQIFG